MGGKIPMGTTTTATTTTDRVAASPHTSLFAESSMTSMAMDTSDAVDEAVAAAEAIMDKALLEAAQDHDAPTQTGPPMISEVSHELDEMPTADKMEGV